VANTEDDTVSELDASTGAVDQTIDVGGGPKAISSDGTHVWVANTEDDTVSELDASTGAVVQTIDVGSYPYGVSSDGTHVWVANYFDNTVSELSASTGSVLQTIGVGNSPQAVSSDGTHVWVANTADNTVTEIDAGTGQLQITTTSLPGGTVGQPYSFALQATGGNPPYTWWYAKGGDLPRGLHFSTAGVLSGTPKKAGNYSITFRVRDTKITGHHVNKAQAALTVTITVT
jgi:YVTN family beta-propeller protein